MNGKPLSKVFGYIKLDDAAIATPSTKVGTVRFTFYIVGRMFPLDQNI